MKRFICLLASVLGLGVNLIFVSFLFLIISSLFETPVPYCFSVFEVFLMMIALLIIFTKNIMVIYYAEKNGRAPDSKEKVIKTIVFGDYVSIIIPIAFSISFFIEEFSVNSFKAYLYPFFTLVYLIYVSWGSQAAWYRISKRSSAHSRKRHALLDMYSKYRITFTVLAYTINIILVFASSISIFSNLLMRSTRSYIVHIVAFSCLNLVLLLIFVYVQILRKGHILIMVCADTVILSLVLLIVILFTDNKIALIYGLNAGVYIFSTLISFLIAKVKRPTKFYGERI